MLIVNLKVIIILNRLIIVLEELWKVYYKPSNVIQGREAQWSDMGICV